MTVDQIVKEVQRQLSENPGQARVERMDQVVGDLVRRREAIEAQLRKELGRRRIIGRKDTTFRISTTRVRGSSGLSMAVCTGGVQIGRIRLRRGRIEFDVPQEVKRGIRDGVQTDMITWSSKDARQRVATLVERVGDLRLGQREQGIEAALVQQMAGGGKRKPADPLRAHQPVTFLGKAVQVPSPVRPAFVRQAGPGWTLGHIDLLARHKRGILRVFEIKQESDGHPERALVQAVWYAAALRYLLEREDQPKQRELYLNFFKIGSRTRPTIHAVAFVSRTVQNGRTRDLRPLHETARRLNACNHSGIGLFAMTYERLGQARGGLPELDVRVEPLDLRPGSDGTGGPCSPA